jgi:hypothetical protein
MQTLDSSTVIAQATAHCTRLAHSAVGLSLDAKQRTGIKLQVNAFIPVQNN